MLEKATIATSLRDADSTARCRFLCGLEKQDIDHDSLQLIMNVAREDGVVDVRLAAIRKMEAFLPDVEVVRSLRGLATDQEIQVADAAVGALARARVDSTREALMEAYLKAPHFGYKWLIFEALTSSWTFSEIQNLVMGYMMADSDEVIRASAVAYLGKQKDSTVVDDLVHTLHDTDARVRANALEALAQFKHQVPRSTFERMLADPHHRVQCAAISILYALGSVGSPATQLDTMVRHRDELFRASAAYVLRQNAEIPNRDAYLRSLATDRSPVVQRQLSLMK